MRRMVRDERSTLYRYRFGTAEFDEARFELTVSGLIVEIQRKPLERVAARAPPEWGFQARPATTPSPWSDFNRSRNLWTG
jgi:hypothetical protein